jgi:hypothetical protein
VLWGSEALNESGIICRKIMLKCSRTFDRFADVVYTGSMLMRTMVL